MSFRSTRHNRTLKSPRSIVRRSKVRLDQTIECSFFHRFGKIKVRTSVSSIVVCRLFDESFAEASICEQIARLRYSSDSAFSLARSKLTLNRRNTGAHNFIAHEIVRLYRVNAFIHHRSFLVPCTHTFSRGTQRNPSRSALPQLVRGERMRHGSSSFVIAPFDARFPAKQLDPRAIDRRDEIAPVQNDVGVCRALNVCNWWRRDGETIYRYRRTHPWPRTKQ